MTEPNLSQPIAPPSAAWRSSPLVSVLVKAFNHAAYIRRIIESILDQSLGDFEIIVTDDASTDDTADILRGFRDPWIR